MRFRSAMRGRAAVGETSAETTTSDGSISNRKHFKGRDSLAYQPVDGDNDASWEDECNQQRRGGTLAVAATTSREETANGMDRTSQAQAHTEGTTRVGLLEPTERGGGDKYNTTSLLPLPIAQVMAYLVVVLAVAVV